jgi:UTP--glucose-1-phosphate uridylyltransferase
VLDAEPAGLKQMVEVFDRVQGPVLAVERVPWDRVSSYGIVEIESEKDGVYTIRDLVEKPKREDAKSNLAVIGRYILTPDLFEELEITSHDRSGEIQLTNGLRRLLQKRPIYGYEIKGVRHDTGNKLGYLKATVYFALKREDLAEEFREYLRGLKL